jgi:hypothetical protein
LAEKDYFGDVGEEKIWRCNLNGTGLEELVTTGLEVVGNIAIDRAGGKMYWADLGPDSLYRANLDGSSVEAILGSELGMLVAVDLDLAAGKIYYSDFGDTGSKIKKANLDGTNAQNVVTVGIGACYGLTLGPDVADCSDASIDDPWLAIVTGVEPYDYAVYMIFDGLGTIDEIGSFNVPDSAGMYSIAPDCSVSGYVWSDAYVPFTGYVYSDTTADMDIGGTGPMPLLKVGDVGVLEGCWTGSFVQDETGTTYNVTLGVDEYGSIVSSTGFIDPVTGKIFFESGYVAGYVVTGYVSSPWEEIVFRDATAIVDSIMTGTFGLDCDACPGGTFTLYRCATGVGDQTPAPSLALNPNYPNPFNPQTTIAYSLAEAGRVNLRIYDASGRVVKTLVDDNKTAGKHTATWNGRDRNGVAVSSGVYFVRLESGGNVQARKIILLK